MTPAALSRITWTLDNQRAWMAAYADARRIARVRARRERQAAERHSVHVDVLVESARGRDDRFFQAQEREAFRGTL